MAFDTIWGLFVLSLVIGGLLDLPKFAKYKMWDKSVRTMVVANSGEITKEEAKRLLEDKLQ